MGKVIKALNKAAQERFNRTTQLSIAQIDTLNDIIERERKANQNLIRQCRDLEKTIKFLEKKLSAHKTSGHLSEIKQQILKAQSPLIIENRMLKEELINQDNLIKRLNHVTKRCLQLEQQLCSKI